MLIGKSAGYIDTQESYFSLSTHLLVKVPPLMPRHNEERLVMKRLTMQPYLTKICTFLKGPALVMFVVVHPRMKILSWDENRGLYSCKFI